MREITHHEIRSWAAKLLNKGKTPDTLVICTKANKIKLAGVSYDLNCYTETSPLTKIDGLHVWFSKEETERVYLYDSSDMMEYRIVDEDADWNLASNEWNVPDGNGRAFSFDNVNKCRDLILKDFTNLNSKGLISHRDIGVIVKKRFGDLK